MTNKSEIYWCILLLLLAITQQIYPQNNQHLSDAVYDISSYIVSENFIQLKENKTSLELIDSIYLHAKNYYRNDISETLLALSFATLSFREMPLSLPFGIKVKLSLPTTDLTLFEKKIKNLPSGFLLDSPST